MPATLRINLLGGFRFYCDDIPVTSLNTSRLQSLVTYLILHRDSPQPRQHLAFLLWPDSTEAQARTNLRHLIHQLRQACPWAADFVCADGNTVQWRLDSPCSLDVDEFEQAYAARDFDRAVQCYRGELLPECYDDWIMPERERLQQMFVASLDQLVRQKEDAGDYAAATDHAQRLLRHDPLREETYRVLMRLHALRGDRASALRVYHACATAMQCELGVEPSAATCEMYERLVNHVLHSPRTKAAPALIAIPPLIGRKTAWAQLHTAWNAALAGRAGMVVIAGEAGIGKTRLAEELVQWAERQGITTASAQCHAAEGVLAYEPIRTWLRACPLPVLNPIELCEVARLLPEALSDCPDVSPPGPLTETWQRQRLFEALAHAVLASHQPRLLLIDDLQWCDLDTLEWLHYLLRFDPAARLLLIGTVRPEETGSDHPVTALLNNLRRHDHFLLIELNALTESDTAQLAQHVAGRELNTMQLADIYRETEGNPLFIVETLRTQTSGEAGSLPPRMQAVLTTRLAQLSPAARELIGVAAIIGREFTFELLRAASDQPEPGLIRALDELWQRRLVRERGATDYDFSHDKIREVAYAQLSTARRHWLHRRVAEALTAGKAADLDVISAQIAEHYERAGENKRAVEFYRRAAEVAQHLYANQDAIEHLTCALALVSQTDHALRYALVRARAKVYDVQGRRDAQAQDIATLDELVEALDDNGLRAEVALCHAKYADAISDYVAAFTEAQTAVILAHSLQDHVKEATVYLYSGRALWQRGEFESARGQLQDAHRLAQIAQRIDIEADSVYNMACIAGYQNDFPLTRDYAEQARRLYDRLNNLPGKLRTLNLLGAAANGLCDYVSAITCFAQALSLCRQLGERRVEGTLLRNLGNVRQNLGDFEHAQSLYEQSTACCSEIGDRRSESETLVFLSLLFHWRGNETRALETSQRGLQLAQSIGAQYEASTALTCLGHALVGLGQLTEATDAYRQALIIHRKLKHSGHEIESLAGLARIALAQGQGRDAYLHVEEILNLLDVDALASNSGYTDEIVTCLRVLRANRDLRAERILTIAYITLQEQAARIADENLRRSFLENRLAHREIVAEWKARHDTAPL